MAFLTCQTTPRPIEEGRTGDLILQCQVLKGGAFKLRSSSAYWIFYSWVVFLDSQVLIGGMFGLAMGGERC